MRKIVVAFLLTFIIARCSFGQTGTVIHQRFLASSIVGNPGGEDAMRRLTIYLPSGYYQSKQHYPVVYFLHGMYGEDSAT
ncbi:MAG: esterase family protein, partial [Bacteroidota bacterium]|nr:esterase family protein [Bacteroidota bacterium]